MAKASVSVTSSAAAAHMSTVNPTVISARSRRKARELKNGVRITSILVLIGMLILVTFLIYNAVATGSNTALLWSGVTAGIIVLGSGYAFYRLFDITGSVPTGVTLLEKKSESGKNAAPVDSKFKTLIQQSLDLITIVAPEGSVQYASPSSERVIGYPADSLVGQNLFELVHIEDHALLKNALSQRTTFFFQFRMQHRDGTWLYFESAGSNMLLDNTVRGIVLNSRDITDRKKEEEVRRQKEMAAIKLNTERENAERERKIIEDGKKQLEEAFKIIEHKNQEITDSITYAFRIQTAMLPDQQLIKEHLPNSFVLWKPKDIVSGDFYWYAHEQNYSLITAADCTGHGVPGAFMTMIGNTLLNQVVKQQGHTSPEMILDNLHQAVRRALKQDQLGSTSRDGMDISFFVYDHANRKGHWAGGNNSLVLVRDNQLIEHKPDKFGIGGLQTESERRFNKITLDIQPGDVVYLYTDGFQDQFGGDKGRKYMTKKFKEYLLSIHTRPMEEQQMWLDMEITNWMGDKHPQVDDILVVGVKF